MTPDKIKNRTVYKESKKLEDRASFSTFSRRETNNSIKGDAHPNDSYESFFDMEEDLGDMKSASEQYAEQENKKVAQHESDTNFKVNSVDNKCIIMESKDE